ncbi:hypothetical protein GCM10010400_25600 [Streptomyces aculeolatus]
MSPPGITRARPAPETPLLPAHYLHRRVGPGTGPTPASAARPVLTTPCRPGSRRDAKRARVAFSPGPGHARVRPVQTAHIPLLR